MRIASTVIAYYNSSIMEPTEATEFKNISLHKEKKVPVIYFSSQSQMGLVEMKDLLWKTINS